MSATMNDTYSGAAFREIERTQYEARCDDREYHALRCSPHVVMNPQIIKDGNAWLCILGDLPTGVVGTGNTPEEACADFDRAWRSNK